MSSEDADDERETPADTPIPWIDSRHLTFTIFVVLPNDNVCTLRDVQSGISVFDLKGKLELTAGLPAQIYYLIYPDGEEIDDDQRLLVHENIQNGYLLKVQIHENWESLYLAVLKNNIEHMYHSGGVHLKGNIKLQSGDSDRIASVVRERGSVALFLASFLGLNRMVNMLLSVDVDVNAGTPFGRTALHAAAARDNLSVLDLLLKYAASIRQTDCYGESAQDVAKNMASEGCAKRLRIMLLNLRGMVAFNQPTDSRSRSGYQDRRHLLKNGHPELPNRSNTVAEIRTRTNLSHVSESHIETYTERSSSTMMARHKRKPTLSASLSECSSVNQCKSDTSYTQPITVMTNNSDSKKLIKWKDVPSGNTYWQVLDFGKNGSQSINNAMDVKPIALLQQRKVLKFDRTNKDLLAPSSSIAGEKAKSDENGTAPRESIFTKFSGSSSPKSVRFSKVRPKYYKPPQTNTNNRTMQRKINIAANYGRSDETKINSDAYEKWLAKKRAEAERSEEDDEDSGLSDDKSDTEMDKLREFNKKVRKRNRSEQRSLTPGNRPSANVINVGICSNDEIGVKENHISSHKDWKLKRRLGQKPGRGQIAGDFMSEERQLEERRQRLLLSAISYDEWLDHSEERKQLINRILQANLEELKRLEEEKFKDRLRFYSYDIWKERTDKREADERKRRLIQKKYEEQQLADRFKVSSAATTFDEWIKSKKSVSPRDKLPGDTPKRKQEEIDSAYDQWLLRKHNEEMERIQTQILNERIQLGT